MKTNTFFLIIVLIQFATMIIVMYGNEIAKLIFKARCPRLFKKYYGCQFEKGLVFRGIQQKYVVDPKLKSLALESWESWKIEHDTLGKANNGELTDTYENIVQNIKKVKSDAKIADNSFREARAVAKILDFEVKEFGDYLK